MEWPLYSPDLNPIEHCWKWIKNWVWDNRPNIRIITGSTEGIREAIIEAVQDTWEALPEEFLWKLMVSMRKRVQTVRRVNGGYTHW